MNVPMFWITLDLVERYYSGSTLRHINRPATAGLFIWRGCSVAVHQVHVTVMPSPIIDYR